MPNILEKLLLVFYNFTKTIMRVYWTTFMSAKKSAELNAWQTDQANIRAARKNHVHDLSKCKIISKK